MSTTNNQIDIKQLMQQIRAEISENSVALSSILPDFKAKAANFNEGEAAKAGELAHCEHLLFLNRYHGISNSLNPAAIVSHRKGLIGKLIVFLKRKFTSFLRESILKDYLQAEQDFLIHLVRHLNFNSRYVDSRDFDLFWQLIHKIDTDVSKALERIERIREELAGNCNSIRKASEGSVQNLAENINSSLGQILPEHNKIKAELATLESVVKGMEGIIAVFSGNTETLQKISESPIPTKVPDLSYVLLENRFRGSEAEIAKRQQFYVNYFSGSSKPILDIGCGRGELLSAMKTAGIAAKGIDLDPAMVQICKSKNLDVELSDLIQYLSKIEDKSLGGIIALQVVEHLPRQVLIDFLTLARKKITDNGLLILETINPTSVTALSSNYFRDPTHVFPQHPDTLGFLVSTCGLEHVETKYLSPVPAEAELKLLSKEVYMTPKWEQMVDLFNHNVKQLNSLLFGFQDFCIIARVNGSKNG